MLKDLRRLCPATAVLAALAGPVVLAGPSTAADATGITGSTGSTAAAAPAPSRRAAPDPASCPRRVALSNGGFEHPVIPNGWALRPDAGQNAADSVPGWHTTEADHLIELWTAPPNPRNIPTAEGNQLAELNANAPSTLFQDRPTTPGSTLHWRVSHHGRTGSDTMALDIGAPGAVAEQRTMTDGADAWGHYSGTYTVPAGQTRTRFALRAVSTDADRPAIGNLVDAAFVGTAPCVIVTKAAVPVGPLNVGDVITYRLTAKNGGDGAADSVMLLDPIPEGADYVPGSLRVVDGPNAGAKSDAMGDDQGHYDAATRTVAFGLGEGASGAGPGRLGNPDVLPDGTTVEFRVKIGRAAAGGQVVNAATVGYEDRMGTTPRPLTSSSGEVKTEVLPAVDLSVVKSADLTEVGVGQTVAFRVGVANAGPNEATGVKVKDVLPGNLAFVSASPSAGAYDPGTGTWNVGGLTVGGRASLVIKAKAKAMGEQTNTATVSAQEFELDPADNTDSVKVCVKHHCPSCGSM